MARVTFFRTTIPRGLRTMYALALMIALLLASSRSCAGQQDNRCFLDSGGSTESFFIREDHEVGQVLGELRVNGRVDGDIGLSLSDAGAPISIEAGTKNLVLRSQLDKEGIDGPSSVSVSVICERKGTTDPGFVIPVNVHVTDVNDNAPEFVSAPYQLNISELTLIGTTIFADVRAVDRDQRGPFSTVEYSVLAGPNSEYVDFVNGLEGTLRLSKALDFERLNKLQIRLQARDQGTPPLKRDTVLTINVLDADDQNPEFYSDKYDARLSETSLQGTKLKVKPDDISAYDKDIGIGSPVFYTFNSVGEEYKYFDLNKNTGQIYLKTMIPDTEFLQPVTLVVKATQFDNSDRYAVTTLTISRGGVFDSELQFLQDSYDVRILENAPLNSVILNVLTNRPQDRRVHFFIEENSGQFDINQKGEVRLRKPMDFEQQQRYSFRCIATDGRRNVSAMINIEVLNMNDWDPRFRYPQYEFYVSRENSVEGHKVGKIEVADGDSGDQISLDIKGPYARVFSINKKGELIIQDLRYLNGSQAHIVIVAEDSGIPPRRASVPVVIKFPSEVSAKIRAAHQNNLMVLLIFGILVFVFFIIIISLIIYICKHKKSYANKTAPANSSGNKMTNYMHPEFSHDKLPTAKGHLNNLNKIGVENPIFNRTEADGSVSYGSRRSSVTSDHRSSSEDTGITSTSVGQPQVLNPLNPRSGSNRYSKNREAKMAARGKKPFESSNGSLSSSRMAPSLNYHNNINKQPQPGGEVMHRYSGSVTAYSHARVTSPVGNGSVTRSVQNGPRDSPTKPNSRGTPSMMSQSPSPMMLSPQQAPNHFSLDSLGETNEERDLRDLLTAARTSKENVGRGPAAGRSHGAAAEKLNRLVSPSRSPGGAVSPDGRSFGGSPDNDEAGFISDETSLPKGTNYITVSPKYEKEAQEARRIVKDSVAVTQKSSGEIGRVDWPRSSIPRRVKKLSWEDENDYFREVASIIEANANQSPPKGFRTNAIAAQTQRENGPIPNTVYF